MKLTQYQIARMIDCSVVRPEVNEDDLKKLVKEVKKYRFIGAHAMPCYISSLKEMLKGDDDILIGGVIGFPFGTSKPSIKAYEAREAIKDGCHEIDMVLNIGKLRSGDYKYVEEDIATVVKTAKNMPVKVIFEIHYLNNQEIKKACELSLNAGAKFVKTSTGNAPTGATVEAIRLMKECVGNKAEVKASGGVRTLEKLIDLYKAGATRFGISVSSAVSIMEQMEKLLNKTIEFEI